MTAGLNQAARAKAAKEYRMFISRSTKIAFALSLLGALTVPLAATATPRDACKLLPEANIAPLLPGAIRQDQPPKARSGKSGSVVQSTCVFYSPATGNTAQFMLITYPNAMAATQAMPKAPTESVAGTPAVWDGNMMYVQRGSEQFVLFPNYQRKSDNHKMAQKIMAIALAAK